MAAASLIAPRIKNPLNLPTDLPNLVPKRRYAANNFGPKSEKNLIAEFIFSLFLGLVINETNPTKNLPPTIAISTWKILMTLIRRLEIAC